MFDVLSAKPNIRAFAINVPDGDLSFLSARLHAARWPNIADKNDASDWDTSYGPPIAWIKELVDEWKDDYLPRWREHEAKVNKYQHYIADVDGLDIHFVYAPADPREDQSQVIPLVLLHGWPGSFLEFLGCISLLTSPTAHGLSGPAFTLFIPSLPGFLFSSPYPSPSFPLSSLACLLQKLVTHPDYLGWTHYGVQGGDWGAAVARVLAASDPDHCKAVHLNFLPAGPGAPLGWLPKTVLLDRALKWAPGWAVGGEEGQRRLRLTKLYLEKQSGYLQVQSSKPFSLGIGLDDSPVALLAWIAEKYGWGSSTPIKPSESLPSPRDDYDYVPRASRPHIRKDLLATVSLYWFTRSATSSTLIYKEQDYHTVITASENYIKQPLAVSLFPEDLSAGAQREDFCSWTGNLQWYRVAPRGGHFAALHDTELFCEHVRDAMREIWKP